VGQKATIALEWSEQIVLSPESEKNKERGRPKGALSEAAKYVVAFPSGRSAYY
jgi:hypothetical protein